MAFLLFAFLGGTGWDGMENHKNKSGVIGLAVRKEWSTLIVKAESEVAAPFLGDCLLGGSHMPCFWYAII